MIISFQKFYGFEGAYRSSYLVKLLLAGLKSQLDTAKCPKLPLSVDQISEMYKLLDLSDTNEITLWAALMFCFPTMLRKCNVVPDGSEGQHVIRRRDVEVTGQGVIVKIFSSKTIRHKERVLKVPIHFVDRPGMCAASMLLAHFARRQGSGEDYLFYLCKNKKWSPLTYKDLLEFLKRCTSKLGLDSKAYGLHSLRRAAATYYHSIGLSLTDVMLMGDWRSMAVFEYIMLPDERKSSIESYVSYKLSFV